MDPDDCAFCCTAYHTLHKGLDSRVLGDGKYRSVLSPRQWNVLCWEAAPILYIVCGLPSFYSPGSSKDVFQPFKNLM